MADETSTGGDARAFPRTRWTLILSARASPEARRAALEDLLAAYWKPLYFYARRKGRSIEAAKDAVQGFFAQLLEKDFLERLDPQKGRLRAYLRMALDNFLRNEHESASALKRGGAARTVPLDVDVAERGLAAAPQDPDAAFDGGWARAVMERAGARLRREFESGKRRGPFEMAMRFFGGGDPPSYEDAAKECGMTAVQFKAFLHRARERFRTLVREEVMQTVKDRGEADGEIRELLKLL
jgi:RNA polymerase sigma-70 factor (ECF subfamily)